jgi:hypothetical protein
MTIKVLTIRSELESASKLGYSTHDYVGNYCSQYDNDIIIRWGNSRLIYDSPANGKLGEFKNVLNPSEVIRRNCQKANATKLLSQVVNVPTLWEKAVPANVLAVVRPHEHSSGYGFSVKKGPFKLSPETYATRYLDVTKQGGEYRVWFCGNKTMAGKRYKMECNEEQEYPCRSMWGYEFCGGISKDLHAQTLLAAKKIGLEFGAADVLFFKGKWYFLELNSAASLDHRVVREFFQKNMELLIKKKFPNYDKTPVVTNITQKKSETPEANVVVEAVVS